jgi:indolepyruvate decarboxylase
MSGSTSRQMTIGEFLLRRLKEAGVRHLFGVPGDYNLERRLRCRRHSL